MNSPRKLMAVLFAILIANPLCCCAAHAAPSVESAEMGCCNHSGTGPHHQPDEEPCSGCQSKNPRTTDAKAALAFDLAPPMAALLPVSEWMSQSCVLSVDPIMAAFPPGIRPPRFWLVLHQRFLI